jgi:site-specific recombinase XerD
MERILKDSGTIQRYRSGPLGLYVQQCAERLCQQGYTREHAHRHIYTVDDFGRWLERHRVALSDVTFDHARRYLDVGRRWKKHGDVAALKRLFEMLAQEGVIPPIGTPQTEAQLVVHNFGTFLSEERALAHRTIINRKTIVTAFLNQRFGRRSFQFSNIKAKDLIGFVQKEATRRRNSIKTVETALRSFTRYLLFSGHLNQDLSIAVPGAPNRRLTGIPRHLTADQVSRVLASCDKRTRTGRRDYAILRLLARLGLRAGEVAALKLDDIDWITGTLTVHGKGGKVRRMPLLHDIGEAISAYLRKDRLSSPDRRIFQRIGAPCEGLGRTAVGSIVRFALERSGVQSTSGGSHQFRHTIGAQMLARGASLAEIGEVLRHESTDTTFVYTKVDLGALRPLARHWPGGAR